MFKISFELGRMLCVRDFQPIKSCLYNHGPSFSDPIVPNIPSTQAHSLSLFLFPYHEPPISLLASISNMRLSYVVTAIHSMVER